MNKGDIVNYVAKQTCTKREAEKAVDAVFDAIRTGLKKDREVRIVDFGTFVVATRKARIGVNPQTGKKMKIPAKKVVKYRPTGKMKKSAK